MTKEGKIPLHKSTPPEITTERITANSKKKKKKNHPLNLSSISNSPFNIACS